MQGRLALLLGGAVVAGAAAYRALVRRPSAPAVPEPHAEALKTKLAEARVAADDREEFEAAETPIDRAESVPPEIADRRRIGPRPRARGCRADAEELDLGGVKAATPAVKPRATFHW